MLNRVGFIALVLAGCNAGVTTDAGGRDAARRSDTGSGLDPGKPTDAPPVTDEGGDTRTGALDAGNGADQTQPVDGAKDARADSATAPDSESAADLGLTTDVESIPDTPAEPDQAQALPD